MTKDVRLLLDIVKSGITEEKITLPDNIDFAFLTKASKKHHIENIVFYGLINGGVSSDAPEISEICHNALKNIYYEHKQRMVIKTVTDAFQSEKIDYIMLKGSVLKSIYPKSDMRSMVDIDILIKTEQYKKIRPLLLKLGFTESEESIHELIWYYQDILIEFHKHLIPSNNKDYYSYFGDGWKFALPTEESSTEYKMDINDEFIFLVTHIAKHFRDSGIGIRYLIDLWIYKQHYTLDEKYLEAKFKELKIFNFYKNIMKTTAVWFNDEKSNELTDFITDYIFNCNVRGTTKNQILSSGLIASKYGGVLSGRALSFFRLVFPDFRHMKLKYPVLEKAPILLPFTYICRWFEAVFCKKGTITKYNSDLRFQTKDNIKEYENNLKYIGLEYNFEDK